MGWQMRHMHWLPENAGKCRKIPNAQSSAAARRFQIQISDLQICG